MAYRPLELNINAETHRVIAADQRTLLEVLREDLGLTGTKHGCDLGECGACTVLIDDLPVLSCLTLALQAAGRAITTIEGLADGNRPHPLQVEFAERGAAQCGYCTPGMLMASRALLDRVPDPTRDDIKHALAGNLCRCTGYTKILDAVQAAAAAEATAG
jgi:carbon-monoxide dehydrogenase small subunit